MSVLVEFAMNSQDVNLFDKQHSQIPETSVIIPIFPIFLFS